jgi:hypothetical protein
MKPEHETNTCVIHHFADPCCLYRIAIKCNNKAVLMPRHRAMEIRPTLKKDLQGRNRQCRFLRAYFPYRSMYVFIL